MSYILSPDSPIYMQPLRNYTVTSPLSWTPSSLSLSISSDEPDLFSPVIPSLNVGYSTPLLSTYDNLNARPELHQQMINYFYYKTLDKWLKENLAAVLSYLKVTGGKVSLVSDLKNIDPSSYKKDTVEDIAKKIEFVEERVFSKGDMRKILKRYVLDFNINWYDLPKKEYSIRQIIRKKIERNIRKMNK